MNRGGPFHRRKVEAIALQWRRNQCSVFTEHRVVDGSTQSFIDVFVDLQGYKVAVEIELSTRHVEANARKAIQVGCDEVHLVFPTARLRDAAQRKLSARLPAGEIRRIGFLLLNDYQARTYVRKIAFLGGKRSTQKDKKPENGT